ncbi:MAG: hypothetical protein ACXVYM_07855, partial [Gaiellaceae bacterium]
MAALPFALLMLIGPAAGQAQAPTAPTGLKAFLLRYDEPLRHDFSRTPSFAWQPVAGSSSYDFELATSSDFRDNSIVWDSDVLSAPLTTPAVSVTLSLPWITGNPYSLYARGRANTQSGTTAWSDDFGFNMRWKGVAAPMTAPPGLLRWTPVDGATGYEVWEVGITGKGAAGSWNKWYFVTSNVTDMRDWYTFHQDPSWTGTARWRVRASRITYGSALDDFNGVSYGPWSPIYTTTNTAMTSAPIALGGSASDLLDTIVAPRAHALMPGFSWTGNRSLTNNVVELYRVYIFSDSDCTNPVFISATVGSPGWAPRLSGPLKLPTNLAELKTARTKVLEDGGQESLSYTMDNYRVHSNEEDGPALGPEREGGGSATPPKSPPPSGSASSPSSGTSTSGGITPPSTLTSPFAKALTLD